jgi:hypothetical protein
VDELFLWTKLLGLVTFINRGGKIAFTIKRHAQRKLRVEIYRVGGKHRLEFDDGAVKVAPAEIEHRVVGLFLQSHTSVPRYADWPDSASGVAGNRQAPFIDKIHKSA